MDTPIRTCGPPAGTAAAGTGAAAVPVAPEECCTWAAVAVCVTLALCLRTRGLLSHSCMMFIDVRKSSLMCHTDLVSDLITSTVRRTRTTLADGREFFYYDDSEPYVSGGATRRLDDPRPLPDRFAPTTDADGTVHPVAAPQMRYDVLTGESIPMATHRMNRTFLPGPETNPLAPARPDSQYADGEIPDTDYDVVVFENRFPSLLRTPETQDITTYCDGNELWPVRAAVGRCEVICFSPDPQASLSTVSPQRMRTIVEAWADRTAALSQLEGIAQVYCFENHGAEIGVTLHHPHGQIYAYPMVTPRTEQMLQQAVAHRQRSEEHTSELQSRGHLVCRLLLEKKKTQQCRRSRIR